MVNFSRIIQVFIGEGLVLAFCIFLTFKILRKDRTKMKVAFSELYIFISIGIILNLIYIALTDQIIVKFLNFLTNFSIFFSAIFLTNFCLIFFYTEEKYDLKKQIIFVSSYAIVLLSMIFITDGVTIDCSTGECTPPVWSIPFFLYIFTILTVFTFVPNIYLSIKILNKFEDEQLKKKWKYFILGFLCLYAFLYGSLFSNTALFDDSIWAPIGLLLAIIGIYLVYYGVAKGF